MPLIYLDQNIYDKIRRGVVGGLKENIKKLFTVVYSDDLSNICFLGLVYEKYCPIRSYLKRTFLSISFSYERESM